MWSHALPTLRCPRCTGTLSYGAADPDDPPTHEFVETGARGDDGVWIQSGMLLCDGCKWLFPLRGGVPILLPYSTPLARQTRDSWPQGIRSRLESAGYTLATGHPPHGEEFVAASFSTEWSEYDYGSTLWTASTEDRLATFRGECGLTEGALHGKRYCEIGCGLGITTAEAATGLGAEAWGVDLSVAVFRAAAHFKDNPRLHFVQASVFALPFQRGEFDFVYSHGVLHHTWSTKEAVRHATQLLRDEGTFYVWLYGYDDVRVSLPRRLAYGLEAMTRPLLARCPPGVATAALLPLIPMYKLASMAGRRSGTHTRTYTAQQALHAARDRFTPMYAHRHENDEVRGWLEELGFQSIHRVEGGEVSPSWSLAIDRNVSIRATARVS